LAPVTPSAAPLHFLIALLAGWLRRRQGEAIEYLRAENRVLRARLGHKRLRFTEAERRLLAEKESRSAGSCSARWRRWRRRRPSFDGTASGSPRSTTAVVHAAFLGVHAPTVTRSRSS
jgi:hypothetical protein